jgi:hypothetical protein
MTHFQAAWEARDACDVLRSGETKLEPVAAAGKSSNLAGHGRGNAVKDAANGPTFSGSPPRRRFITEHDRLGRHDVDANGRLNSEPGQ